MVPADDASSTPSIGLALGAGGARGFAHVPVLEVFDELGLRPSCIAGSSMGAIIGAAYASGMSGRDIRDYILSLVDNRAQVLNRFWSLRPDNFRDALGGLRLGRLNLPKLLRAFLPEALPSDFAALKMPLKVIATDYYGQCERVCESGDLFDALGASAAIPALFAPVLLDGRLMIDGGIFNPVPYDHLIGQCELIVAVDVIGAPEGDGSLMPSRMDSLFGASQLMMQSNVALKMKLYRPDIYLCPEVGTFRVLDFFRARQILDAADAIREPLKRQLAALVEQRAASTS